MKMHGTIRPVYFCPEAGDEIIETELVVVEPADGGAAYLWTRGDVDFSRYRIGEKAFMPHNWTFYGSTGQ